MKSKSKVAEEQFFCAARSGFKVAKSVSLTSLTVGVVYLKGEKSKM